MWYVWRRWAALICGGALVLAAVPPAAAAARTASRATAPRVICVASTHAYDKLAIKIAHDVGAALAGRVSTVGLQMTDNKTGITCTYHANTHFIAASAIKVTILAALLRKAQEQHRSLSASEARLARLMITQSSNSAATALWNDVGYAGMQHFLNLAGMTQTRLSPAWGLTLLTAHDEIRLLTLLSSSNGILTKANRIYARYLMARVVSWQRWGVPAGAPTSVTVHLKNGWLPYPRSLWEINSIGIFTSQHRVYLMAILTYSNPSMTYGINTVQGAARAMNRDLNPATSAVVQPSTANPAWGISDGSKT